MQTLLLIKYFRIFIGITSSSQLTGRRRILSETHEIRESIAIVRSQEDGKIIGVGVYVIDNTVLIYPKIVGTLKYVLLEFQALNQIVLSTLDRSCLSFDTLHVSNFR